MARPPEGPNQVERLDGDAEAKRRLRVILETLSGERSVEDACTALGVSASRFHELRRDALEAALGGLEPGVAGRPRRPSESEPSKERLAELERENRELELELQASYVRTEIALAMPQLLTPKARAEIKKKAKQAKRAVAKRGEGDGSGT
jgi:transposase-like protein